MHPDRVPEVRTCQECGAPLASDAPEGFCPTCMLEGALKIGEKAVSAATSQVSRADLGFLLPCDVPGRIGRLAQYEIVDVVGRGGMGIVLRAHDTKLQRIVAIKAMVAELAANPTAVKRFLREARAAAAVRDDRVITIFAVEDGHDVPFLVMEFIQGQSLQNKLDRGTPSSLQEILRIGMQIAEGLAAAHRQGLVHRDIKPANILLENGVERVKITDFGLARAVDDLSVTQTSQMVGTPLYMAPEQAQGQSVDHRADLFALGAILYAMCTGQPAFRAETLAAVLNRVCNDTPRPIEEINPDIPEWLTRIVGRLLAKRPEERFQSADEVAGLLRDGLAAAQSGGQPRMRFRTSGFEKSVIGLIALARRYRGVAVATMLLLLIVCGLGILKIVKRPPGPAVAPFAAAQARHHQEAWSQHLGVPIGQTNSLGMLLRLIPPGEFQMGSAENDVKLLPRGDWFFAGWASDRIENEMPRHRVRITRPFAMSVHEVTIAQFRKFVTATGYQTVAQRSPHGGFGWSALGWRQSKDFNWVNAGYDQTEDHPVSNVAWEDANEFCRWLSQQEGRTYRLPTEAEWEFACRAGTQTWFQHGDRDEGLKVVANIADEALKSIHPDFTWARSWNDGFAFTAPVGQFGMNAFGLHDMHGNVWEWCLDFYDPKWYRRSAETDPVCRNRAAFHVFRGGGWDNYPGFCRSADRYSSHSQTLRTDWAGFRVVLELR
ncbi:MAG: bifunctional serine/threonine-protein kinase/formylglycine-generating enzyme family protein [Verrucomicrobia subdivision 3 bacterium]|nr:bifunctional serine/threonine-protein kinase/formylglycine-generating enzyme family protein [Limisphaerales bacterium]